MADKKCDIAPFNMNCVYGDGKHLISCGVHRLNAAGRALLQSIPIIGESFENYHCPDFELEKETDDATD